MFEPGLFEAPHVGQIHPVLSGEVRHGCIGCGLVHGGAVVGIVHGAGDGEAGIVHGPGERGCTGPGTIGYGYGAGGCRLIRFSSAFSVSSSMAFSP